MFASGINPNLSTLYTKSKSFVNDIPVGVNYLAEVAEKLIEIHGQHDQRGLLNVNSHLAILDQFAGNDSLLKDIKTTYKKLKNIEERIIDLKNKKEQVAREKDYLEHVVQELESADIQPEEEEQLIAKKDLLSGKGKIIKFLGELNSQLTEANSNLINAQRTVLRNQNIINNFPIIYCSSVNIPNRSISR